MKKKFLDVRHYCCFRHSPGDFLLKTPKVLISSVVAAEIEAPVSLSYHNLFLKIAFSKSYGLVYCLLIYMFCKCN